MSRYRLTNNKDRWSLKGEGCSKLTWAIGPINCHKGHVATYSWGGNRLTPFTIRKGVGMGMI